MDTGVIKVDCRGLECPKPVLKTKDALDKGAGCALECIVDNEAARQNVGNLLKSRGIGFEITQHGTDFHLITDPAAGGLKARDEDNQAVYLIKSDTLGTGQKELGNVLMKSFIFTVSQQRPAPKALIFLNAGVYLTTIGSQVLDDLKDLESRGVSVMSCGTCLDYYGVKDRLCVGRVTNMYEIVENLWSHKVISV